MNTFINHSIPESTIQIGMGDKQLESIVYCLSQAIDRLAELRDDYPPNTQIYIEIGAIRELVRDARGPINASLHTLYSFNKK